MAKTKKSVSRKTADDSAAANAEPRKRRPLLVYLQALLPSLHRTERLIAEYILEDPERVLSSSIAEIREGAGASVGAIVGFCRRLGVEGFASFKIALARELAQSGFTPVDGWEGQKGGSLFERVFKFHAQSLVETLQINSEETLQQTADILRKARHIEFFSTGMSYPVAYSASSKFRLIGLPASTQFDSHFQLVAATQLKKGDVAFAISCSGNTRETVDCLKAAREKHATTICLTNSMKSPLTAYADLALYATPSEVKYFQAPLASRITQLAVVDALFVSVAQRSKNKTAKQLQISAEELLKRRVD